MIITQSPLESIQDLNFRLHIQTYLTKTLATDKKIPFKGKPSHIWFENAIKKKWKFLIFESQTWDESV